MKHLTKIIVEVIEHKDQRYDTAGDYVKSDKGCWLFRLSKMKADYEFLLLIHELTEWYLTQKRGISEPSIMKFDTETVIKVDPKNECDPGRSKYAPYHKEHMFAERIEKLIAKELSVDWKEYQRQYDDLIY